MKVHKQMYLYKPFESLLHRRKKNIRKLTYGTTEGNHGSLFLHLLKGYTLNDSLVCLFVCVCFTHFVDIKKMYTEKLCKV